ncbi:MAG: hypothetical protein H7321_07560, partial [Bacteroidia bacterium]|nr:hypothetical protein [Bacteroidia bacterium]
MKIIIKPVFGNSVFSIDSFYSSHKCGRVKIDRLKFYISGISLYKSGSLVFNDSDFYLLDASDFSSFSLPVNIPSDLQYDKVKFNVGVDSLTNVS